MLKVSTLIRDSLGERSNYLLMIGLFDMVDVILEVVEINSVERTGGLKGGYLLSENPSKEIMFATEETTAIEAMQLTQSHAGEFRIA